MKRTLISILLIILSSFALSTEYQFEKEIGEGDFVCITHGEVKSPSLARSHSKFDAQKEAQELCAENSTLISCQKRKNTICERSPNQANVIYTISQQSKTQSSNSIIISGGSSGQNSTCNIKLGRTSATIQAPTKIEAKAIAHLFCEHVGYFVNFCLNVTSDC